MAVKAELLSFQIIARDVGVAAAAAIIGAVSEAAGVVIEIAGPAAKKTFDMALAFLGPITPTAAVEGAIWVAIDATSLEWQYDDYIGQIQQVKFDEEQDGYI